LRLRDAHFGVVARTAELVIGAIIVHEISTSLAFNWLCRWACSWTNVGIAIEMTIRTETFLFMLVRPSKLIADNCIAVDTRKVTIDFARVERFRWLLGAHGWARKTAFRSTVKAGDD
jgi:hypothetical protein